MQNIVKPLAGFRRLKEMGIGAFPVVAIFFDVARNQFVSGFTKWLRRHASYGRQPVKGRFSRVCEPEGPSFFLFARSAWVLILGGPRCVR